MPQFSNEPNDEIDAERANIASMTTIAPESDSAPMPSDEASHRTFAFDSLEALRKKLLDITARNSLLNFRYSKTNSIRLVDELPDQIAEVLRESSAFSFIPVPEPTERELIDAGYIRQDENGENHLVEYPSAEVWAKQLDINTAYDLPPAKVVEDNLDRHSDKSLQTLMYSSELDSRLRHIRNRAQTAIDESGANILYLVLGFIEWKESRDSDKKYLAPLFTLPVDLSRSIKPDSNGVFRYSISIRDDGLITNITLREKLLSDFGLNLEDISEDQTPEEYYQTLSNTILQQQPTWRIRRQAGLVLLNFTKQAMYEDLDPENWPQGAGLEEHPIVSHLFGSGALDNEDGSLSYSEEYKIDDLESVHEKFPIIYDADSSQHSALVDAVKGENLVIEGPPGTGKSQTITNLIAASIANGKRVLFVAEKMAALNVVKDRLDAAGLGDFCLELHSHKTNKQKFLESLGERLNKQSKYREPKNIHSDIALLESQRSKLSGYAELINSEWRKTGRSIHEILTATTRLREQLNIDPEQFVIDEVNGNSTTELRRRELLETTLLLLSIYSQTAVQAGGGEIRNHYWYGVNDTELLGHHKQHLIEALENWNQCLELFFVEASAANERFELQVDSQMPLEEIKAFTESATKLPDLIGGEPLSEMEIIVTNQPRFSDILDRYKAIHLVYKQYADNVREDFYHIPASLTELTQALNRAGQFGVQRARTISELAFLYQGLGKFLKCAERVEEELITLRERLPTNLQSLLACTPEGLKELKAFVALCEMLPTHLWKNRDPIFDDPDLDGLLAQLTTRLKPLVGLHTQLDKTFNLSAVPLSTELKHFESTLSQGGFFKWLSPAWRQARRQVLSYALSTHRVGASLSLLPELIEYADALEDLKALNNSNRSLGEHYRGVDTPIDDLNHIRRWYKAIRDEYGRGFSDRAGIADAAFTLDRDIALNLIDFYRNQLGTDVSKLLSQISVYRAALGGVRQIMSNTEEVISTAKILVESIESILAPLTATFVNDQVSIDFVYKFAADTERQQQIIAEWDTIYSGDFASVFDLSIRPGLFSKTSFAIYSNTLCISRILSENQTLRSGLYHKADAERYEALRQLCQEFAAKDALSKALLESYRKAGDVNETLWMASSSGKLELLIYRNQRALENPKWLDTWLEYLTLRNRLASEGHSAIIRGLEDQIFPAESIKDVVDLVINYQLSQEIFSESTDVKKASGMEQKAVQDNFRENDINLLKLQREMIAFRASRVAPPSGISSGRVSDYSEMGLIRHNLGLKKPRIALRGLMCRSGASIQALKPCFMMSPMSVAQYLVPGQHKFDLVVMDEASQIRPEDALGAIARGQNLIVVGDPKQLPPTSFFQRIIGDDDNNSDEAVGLQQSESILDCVMPMFRNRRLRWHYRSRHESLIAFSNLNFYGSNLVLFPSPFSQDNEFGVKFKRVRKGRFNGGKNTEEAKSIVAAVIKQMIERPSESIGIVAMNSRQADEIEMQLEQKIAENISAQSAYEKNLSLVEPLFVKNLENVQGDERDVMFISMTYGPEEAGSPVMAQRFGPINQDVGWRRLNVLFTRSKKRMMIFSSMDSGHVRTSDTSSRGVLALRGFLEFSESGRLTHRVHTGKPADSDFEVSVKDLLEAHGYECEPQLGVAGYFLDIAVRDPGQPGRFLMGIECDGATYHSAKSARDRDRLRQAVLESLGWKIRRIWSTDWFKHPAAQLAPILEELDKLRTISIPENLELAAPIVSDIPLADHDIADMDDEGFLPDIQIKASQGLKERLQRFEREVIREKYPNMEPEKGLLRPEMLEILLRVKPESKADFLELVPKFLREGTAIEEAIFLEQVVELISLYG